MAKIVWHVKATKVFSDYVENASLEFGSKTARRWQKERKAIEWRLERYPSSYPPEKLLVEEAVLYRQFHMMSRRFKLIYYYDEGNDVVTIMDIWDTRMNPKALIKRIK